MALCVLRFGLFELDGEGFQLRREGRPVKIDRIPLELLFLLAGRPGKLVSHNEALDQIWGKGVFIEGDSAVYTAIRKIRQALGDDPAKPRYVETVSRKGYRFIGPLASVLPAATKQPDSEDRVLLAVLPLGNLSGDPKQEYFSDGLTEELITELGRLSPRELGVIARTTVMRYKGTRESISEIGRELGVNYLLEGSARHERGRVRISVQLVRATDETHVWAESFERPLGDILRVQAEVAKSVAESIRLTLVHSPRPSPPLDPQVYDLYLRARSLWERRTFPSIRKAIELYQKALHRDASYAPAWAGLAHCYAVLPITSDFRPRQSFPQAREAVDRALALDSTLPEAHVARGIVNFWFDWNWTAAEQEFRRAIELNPSDPSGPMFLAHLHSNLTHHHDAMTEIQSAQQLDPLSRVIRTHEGQFLYNAHRYDEAIIPLKRVLELAPRFWVAHIVLGKAFGVLRRDREAFEEFTKAYRDSSGNTEALGLRGYTLAMSSKRVEARHVLRKLERAPRGRYVPFVHRAFIWTGLGEYEAALDLLEQAVEERDVRLTFLAVEPRWDPLRTHARFVKLGKRAGFSKHMMEKEAWKS